MAGSGLLEPRGTLKSHGAFVVLWRLLLDIQRRKSGVALLSVISNTTLVVSKLWIGLAIGSVSVISEAIHSGVDLLAALIALFAVRTAGKPADEEHPFGHGKIENVSGTIEALLIFGAAGWIIFEAIKKIMSAEPFDAPLWGIVVMLISALANIIVSHMLFKVGKETESVALQADAWHLRTDVWTSAGVMFGLVIIFLGKLTFPDLKLNWIDPVAAICVALLIVRAAYHLTVESGKDLLDASLTPEEARWIREYISSQRTYVRGFHHLHTRKSGATRFVQFHLLVDANASVEESHHLSHEISSGIKEQYPGTVVTIHIEPCNGFCSSQCSSGCLMPEKDRETIHKNASAK